MPKILPLTLRSAIADWDREAGEFQFRVETDSGRLTIHGHLTAGSRGWMLRAKAACRRSTITVHITAIETAARRLPDLEHHRYHATIDVQRPGRYSLRVAHAFVLKGESGVGLARPVFEQVLHVP